jgi:copper transport protein
MRWLLLAAAALLAIPAVAGHAVYLDSSPVKGERLDQAPYEVWVLLTEPVDPDTYSFKVVSSNGEEVSIGKASLVASPQARLSIALKPDVPEGAYLARWQVLSTADGHVTSGSTGFAIGNANPPSEEGGETTQASLLSPWARLAAFTGMALAAGAILFSRIAGTRAWAQASLPRLLLIGATLNAAGVALLFLDTVQQSSLPAATVASTGVGSVLLARLAASLAIIVVAAWSAKTRVITVRQAIAGAVSLAVAGAASARLGHASLAGASAILVDLMHLTAVVTRIGGVLVYLTILYRANRHGSAEDVRVLGRSFSPIAAACVIVLLVSGVATTWTIAKAYVPALAFWQSPWGRFLGVKIGLMLIVLSVGALNRRLLLGDRFWAPSDDPVPTPDRLRRLVQVEAIFGVGTLFLAALLTSISPPATAAVPTVDAMPEPFESHGEAYMMLGRWSAAPSSGSSTTLEFRLTNHHGDPVVNNTCGRDDCILLQVRPEGTQDMQVYPASPRGGGQWSTEAILWVSPGQYKATLQVQTADVYLDKLSFTVTVA